MVDDMQKQRLAQNGGGVPRDQRADHDARRAVQYLDTMIQTAICEWSDEKCVERVSVTPKEYGFVRSKPNRFLVAPRHNQPEIERVIYRHDRYWVVEKLDS